MAQIKFGVIDISLLISLLVKLDIMLKIMTPPGIFRSSGAINDIMSFIGSVSFLKALNRISKTHGALILTPLLVIV